MPSEDDMSDNKPSTSRPKTQVMVDNALITLNDRTGSSLLAIKKFIGSTYNVDVNKAAGFIKIYIKNSLESGKLVQTKGKGMAGSFKLSGKKPPKPKSIENITKKNVKKKDSDKVKRPRKREDKSSIEGKKISTKTSAVKKTTSEKDSAKNIVPSKKPVKDKKNTMAKKDAATKKSATAKEKIQPGEERPIKKAAPKKKEMIPDAPSPRLQKKKTQPPSKIKEMLASVAPEDDDGNDKNEDEERTETAKETENSDKSEPAGWDFSDVSDIDLKVENGDQDVSDSEESPKQAHKEKKNTKTTKKASAERKSIASLARPAKIAKKK